MLKQSASYILTFLVFIVTLVSANAGQQWFPERKDLEVMSLRNAIIVNAVAILVIIGFIYMVIRVAQG